MSAGQPTSADASKRVLLIEAGRRDDYHWIHIPVGYLNCIGNPRTDWLDSTEPRLGSMGVHCAIRAAKTLGGSSSINGMICMRGQARDYDQWASLTGDEAWTWKIRCPISSCTKTTTKVPERRTARAVWHLS
ncbi:MAG: GMC family oxidoreductase [Rhodoferax sp.]|nr:GMC family oxidoreductase [Rhodoferax sp.]